MGKVLLVNGSPRQDGNTFRALEEAASRLESLGLGTEIIWIGRQPMQGCIACEMCSRLGKCTYDDEVYRKVFDALKESDALIVGSPTYWGGPNGALCALLDRVFYSARRFLENKVWASVAVSRRGGASMALQRLNMYAMSSNMVMATSQYYDIAFGRNKGESEKDTEGLQTMRTLADNVAWLVKSTSGTTPPRREPVEWFSVVRH